MNKLEQLINDLCTEGVEYKTLGELGAFYSGLSGKSKDDFSNGNAKFITYMNVFSNLSLKIDVDDKVKIGENENQNTIQYGDILFTGSSETLEECGMSSVLTSITDEKLYLNSFCFGFRFYDEKLMLPEFSKYVFRSSEIRKQIKRTASGVTRFNVSKKKMEKVTIPLPPILVQEEIVRILDKFTELTAELTAKLTAELTARQKQYSFYRDYLLDFADEDITKKIPDIDCSNVEYKKLGDIADITRGGKFQKKDFVEQGKPCIHYGQIYTRLGITTQEPITYLNNDVYNKSKKAVPKDIVMAVTSENVEDVCKCTVWVGNEDIAVSGHTAIIHPIINSKFLAYYFQTTMFFKQKRKFAHGTKVIEVTPDKLNNIIIPVPPISVQENIVKILDRFDKLNNDISEGLPAEIEARRKQYEYYRDKLLTFKKKEIAENE